MRRLASIQAVDGETSEVWFDPWILDIVLSEFELRRGMGLDAPTMYRRTPDGTVRMSVSDLCKFRGMVLEDMFGFDSPVSHALLENLDENAPSWTVWDHLLRD